MKFQIILLLALLLLTLGCGRSKTPVSTGTNGSKGTTATQTSTQSPVNKSGVIPSESAQIIGEFQFVDEDGKPFTDADTANRLLVVNFIFTTCPGTCLRQSDAMEVLQDRITKADSSNAIRLMSITVNPEVDTPEVLKDYAAQYNADPKLWKFLTGDKESIWNFSKNNLGMSVAANPADPLIPIAHESKFAVIDRAGKLRGYFDALDAQGFEQLWSAIDTVLPEFQPNQALLAKHNLPAESGHIAQPANILDSEWLDRFAQMERDQLIASDDGLPGFQFTECRSETGITFHPQIVDDQRHRLLVNHYDHGNSISVADVDNDGHLDLYFVSQVGPNELWRCLGDGRFENITAKSATGLADRICVAGSFCDVDNDGDADLFVTSIRNGNALLQNDGTGKFTDITASAGLEYSGHSSKATFFDYDRDGLPDLFLSNVGKFTTEENVTVRHDLANSQPATTVNYHVGRGDAFSGHLVSELAESSILYRNLGNNRFADVTKSTGLANDAAWSGDAIVFDCNQDNWPDLYVCNMQGHDRLYVNEQGKSFSDKTTQFLKKTPWGTMGAAVLDFDNDGRFDLFLTDMHSDMSKDVGPESEKLKSDITWPEEFVKSEGRSIYGNAFFQQLADGEFSEVSQQINAENYWPWGLSCGDFDADGYQDAFLCSSMCFPYRYSVNSLLLNSHGKRFLDAHFTVGVEPRKPEEMIAPWFSLDFSGQDSESRLRQGRDGTHVVWSATGTRSSAIIDFDEDGDLDIITNEFNTPPQVFRNNINDTQGTNFLKVRLRGNVSENGNATGTKSTRDALGAIVIVETAAGTQRQLNNGASGYLSQSVMPMYFGLGDAQTISKVTVIWPSGATQDVTKDVAVNQLLEIAETSPTAN